MLRQRTQHTEPPSFSENLQSAERKIKKNILLLWDELHPWQQDNSHIHSAYRPASSSFRASLSSLFYLHNETVNIYTHLIGAIFISLSSVIIYNTLAPRYPSASRDDVIAFACFFAGAAACLGMSATFHTISNHSHAVGSIGNKLDYIGIVFLIWGSVVPSMHYGFCGLDQLQRTYWTMISILAVGCTAITLMERFRSPAWRPYRAGCFIGLGMSAVIPVAHGVKMYGVEHMQNSMGLNWVLLMGFLYLLGAGLYAARWPERSWPGSFDIWGSSHQIFHVLVVAAATSHLVGLIKAFDYHHRVYGRGC